MLKWIYGHTNKDKIRNKHIREKGDVASSEGKMVEDHLEWFGYI